MIKKINRFFVILVILQITLPFVKADAQNRNVEPSLPLGQIVYSLPSTTLGLKVYAESDFFVAGPYARYAEKYLGVKTSEVDESYYKLIGVELTPYLEADQENRYTINLTSNDVSLNFLKLTSQGLIALSDVYVGRQDAWRFPSQVINSSFIEAGTTSNLTETKTTLYKNVKTAEGINRVPVSQSQVVEKSLEKKAQEVASLIFKLRKKRIEIITGDTDAVFDGEAMGATLAEISRLEKEYIELFLGKSVKDTQVVNFDIVPKAMNNKQLYIAFRFSETDGILPSSNVLGRPIVVEISEESKLAKPISEERKKSNRDVSYIYYGVPLNCNIRVFDGQQVLLETRTPIYQLGEVHTFPIFTK